MSRAEAIDLPADEEHALCARMAGDLADAAYRDGYHLGYVSGVLDVRAAQRSIVRDLDTELERWTVLCRRCRLGGRRDGCRRCQTRDRATFGRPHPDDYEGGPVSWDESAARRDGARHE